MSKRRAIVIVGGASTGTRLVARMFEDVGFVGNAKHYHPTDGLNNKDYKETDNLFIRRSYPHSEYTPDLKRIYNYLKDLGFESIFTVVTMRGWKYVCQSQVDNGYVQGIGEANIRLQNTYRQIFRDINDDYLIVNYECLVMYPEQTQKWLFDTLRITGHSSLEIVDGNAKYEVDNV